MRNFHPLMGIVAMGKDPFQIFGPFQVDKGKVAEKEYLKAFWKECDDEFAQISVANGLYLFSLANGNNYQPYYVGITKREFCKEVFNPSNVVKILNHFAPQKGKLNLHLVAKPKNDNAGFYRSSKRSLLWTEMFLLMLCRKKNPEILNIVGHAFLEDCAIEGITYSSKGHGKTIKTFQNALGFDSFATAGNNNQKKSTKSVAQPASQPAATPTPSPITQANQPSAHTTQTGE
ncbi:MAG TPA: hypothetical protein VGF53_16835 [Pseudolabrys sp.]|jgi:hypothetical protein